MTRRVHEWSMGARCSRRVYRLPGTTRTGRQRAMAAVLVGRRPSAAISHTTAARLLRLDAVRSRRAAPDACRPRRGLRRNDLRFIACATLPRGDLVAVDGIRCTSATRTIIDCAALLDDEALEAAFEQARRMGLTSVDRVARGAPTELCGRGRPGSARRSASARGAAARRTSDGVATRGEARAACCARARSLRPERQYPVGRFRLDFAWPAARIACECDGFEHHGSRLAWKRDREPAGRRSRPPAGGSCT